ncbi:arrestin domain-containing protein A-like [Corticium candelabrum]|uniref:arrestin domain-containing protein A-like n=1 Tax=Corticium candelabrum TaxID=121492 RepID=UPI002E26DC99|nr:arrestin domain-containing protein A-like [Corticium candelabrum]
MNQIFVRTNKGEYIAGETVYGCVYLNIVRPIASKGMKLKVKGLEKCDWEYTYNEQDEDRYVSRQGEMKGKKEFFKVEIRLIDYPGGFPMGCFAYPFQYTLPQSLPGVFSKEDKQHGEVWKAAIKYRVKAEVDIPGTKHDLQVKQPLIVYSELRKPVEPVRYDKQGTVRTCCCIPRGDVLVQATMDKNSYFAGETAQIHVDVDNQSAVDIENFAVKLMRVITLKGKDDDRNYHDSLKLIDTVCENKYDGCPANSNKSRDVPLELFSKTGSSHKELQPTTGGSVVSCSYHVDIEMQVPWAPDIEIHAPVQILAPVNVQWQQWQPPSWVSQCVQTQVVGPYGVAPEVLASQAFAGIPGF